MNDPDWNRYTVPHFRFGHLPWPAMVGLSHLGQWCHKVPTGHPSTNFWSSGDSCFSDASSLEVLPVLSLFVVNVLDRRSVGPSLPSLVVPAHWPSESSELQYPTIGNNFNAASYVVIGQSRPSPWSSSNVDGGFIGSLLLFLLYRLSASLNALIPLGKNMIFLIPLCSSTLPVQQRHP